MIVDRDAYGLCFAGLLDVLERALPFVAIDPFRIPHVQLLQVDGIEPEVLQAALGDI